MRHMFSVLVCCSVILSAYGGTSGLATGAEGSQEGDLDSITDLLKSGNFLYHVQTVNPVGGNPIYPTSEYYLSAESGTYKADLPYFGRSYRADLGVEGGIHFEGTPQDLEFVMHRRRNTVSVSFTMDAPDDHFDVTMEIGAGSYGSMTIISQNRRSISYYGYVTGPGER
jgi:hypothetical protein